jgi:hypothetical protein
MNTAYGSPDAAPPVSDAERYVRATVPTRQRKGCYSIARKIGASRASNFASSSARELGFDLLGIASLGEVESAIRLDEWIAASLHRHSSQSVRPWNVKFSRDATELAFTARAVIAEKDARTLATEVLAMRQDEFSAAFRKSSVKRAKLAGFAAECASGIGTLQSEIKRQLSRNRGEERAPRVPFWCRLFRVASPATSTIVALRYRLCFSEASRIN